MTTDIHAAFSNGPSKFDLMLALFDRKSVNTRDVEFKLAGEGNASMLIVITEVGIEDGSGESWLFKGRIRRVLPEQKDGFLPPPRKVHGWYHTGTRKGWIKLDE